MIPAFSAGFKIVSGIRFILASSQSTHSYQISLIRKAELKKKAC